MASHPFPPRLAHITTVPLSLEAFLSGPVSYMRQRGFEVYAISPPGPLLDAFAAREGIQAVGVEMSRSISPRQDLTTIIRLYHELRRIKPTIVHAYTPKGGLLGMIAAILARTPVRVYHIFGLPYLAASGRKRLLLRLMEFVSCLLAHRVLTANRSMRESAIRDHLCSAHKIQVLGGSGIDGVDAARHFNPALVSAQMRRRTREQWGIPEGAPVLGYVGRLVRDKGVTELVEAYKLLRADLNVYFLDAKVRYGGDGTFSIIL